MNNIFDVIINFFIVTMPAIFENIINAIKHLFVMLSSIDFAGIIMTIADFFTKAGKIIKNIIDWITHLF